MNVSLRPNYFIFMEYLKTGGGSGGSSESPEPLLIRHWSTLLRQNDLQRQIYKFHLGIITCDLSVYTMGHSKVIVSNEKEKSISKLSSLLWLLGLNELSCEPYIYVSWST